MHVVSNQYSERAAYDLIACVQVIVTIRADVNDMGVSKEQGDLPFKCSPSSVLFSSLGRFYGMPRLAHVLPSISKPLFEAGCNCCVNLDAVFPRHSGSETCCAGAVAVDVVSSELPTLLQSSIARQLHAAWKQHSLNEGQAEPLSHA